MTLLPALPIRLAVRRHRSSPPAGPSLTITTPLSPQPPGRPLVVSGTYAGTVNSLTVIWQHGQNTVGAPVEATAANGLWSAVLTTPAALGTYTLRATLNGTLTADSGPITIAEAAPDVVATFGFEGTGQPAGTIDLFGHAFPQGAIPTGAPVVLRTQGGSTVHRTQMNVLTRWPDQSVKTALFAAELPALADGQLLAAELVSGQAHPDPGPGLNLATLLSGRTAVVRTWAPGDTTTPLWTFDVVQAALASADRWHQGPLAVSTRVETPVPATAVQNTSGQTGQIASVRLVVDVIATKDGFLELDVCFSNDRVFHAQGGIARFGYTIEIDGQIVYDQRPASGAARDLLMYSQWIRRRGRKADGTLLTGWGSSNRPFFRPDLDVLVASGVQLNYDRSRPLEENIPGWAAGVLANAASRQADPYWNYSIARAAGDVGGRPEIGYRTWACAAWLRDGGREAEMLAHREFEAASTRGIYYYDWELGRWVNPVDWPKLSYTGTFADPPGTSRQTARGLPSNQRATHNVTDHITVDFDHHGSFYFTPALLSGRRLCYDGLAAKVCWSLVSYQDRADGGLPVQYGGPNPFWRDLEPDHTTGHAWGARPWDSQVRGFAWNLRDFVDAAAILPENYPNRLFYDRTVEAHVNAYYVARNDIYARIGTELGLPILHKPTNHTSGFMYSFIFFGAISALRQGLGGPNMAWFVRELARFRIGSILHPDSSWRNACMGRDIHLRSGSTWATTWAQVTQFTQTAIGLPDEDLVNNTGEGDWQRNVLVGLGLLAIYGPDEEIRAQAMEALVFLRSERARGVGNNPRYRQDLFFGSFFQSNSVFPPELHLSYASAPTILPNQTLSVPLDAENGTLVGRIQVRGPFPRNSGISPGPQDAFVVVSQPAGNPFSVSPGGAVRVANQAALAALTPGNHTLSVYCRTFEQWRVIDPAIEHRSATVNVTITVTVQAPFIAEVTSPFVVGNNAPVGAFVGQLTITGTRPYTVTIVSGDPNGLFAVSNTGTITVAADLSGQSPSLRNITVRVTAPGGTFDRVVPIDLQGAIYPPVIAAGQTLSVPEAEPVGTFLTPDLNITGSPPTSLTIISGNTGNRFEAVLPNRIRTAQVLNRTDATSYTLRVRAVNSAGASEENVAVNVTPMAWAWGAHNMVVLGAYSPSTRLRTGYTGPLFRARRVSDGVEQDFGEGASVVTPAELQTFANGGRVELAGLYDQGLLGNHFLTPSAHGRPFLTDASGNPFTLNGRLVFRTENARGLKRTNFATLQTASVGACVIARPTAYSGGSMERVIAVSSGDNGDDAAGATALRLAFISSRVLAARHSTDSAAVFPVATNTTYFMGAVSSPDADWRIRALHNNNLGWSTTGSVSAMNPTCAARIGYYVDNGAQNQCLNGLLGMVVIFGFIDRTTALPALRSWMMGQFGLT